MQSTRRELLDDFLDFVGEPDDDDARNVAERLLNRSIDSIYLKHPFKQFRAPAAHEITLVAGTRSYALPSWFGRFQPRVSAFDLTHQSEVTLIDEMLLKQNDPVVGTSLEPRADPLYAYLGGMSALETEVSTAGTPLEAVSDNANDTNIELSVEGIDSNNRQKRTKVTLTGMVAVALGTWKPPVMFVGKAYQQAIDAPTEFTSSLGTVTVQGAGAGAPYLTLQADESAKQQQMVNVSPLPASTTVLALPYLLAPKKMLYGSDALPMWWDAAIWEEMLIQWRINAGEVTLDTNVPRPEFVNLVAFDNSQGPAPKVRAYR
jgi:hypothetical protein